MSTLQYSVRIMWSNDDECFVARCLELPGCAADGETFLEAAESMDMAIQGWVETAKSEKRKLPKVIDEGSLEKAAEEHTRAIQEQIQKEASVMFQQAINSVLPKLAKQLEEKILSQLSPPSFGFSSVIHCDETKASVAARYRSRSRSRSLAVKT
jgi:predicted RNase H-like HicB family nuclease